MGMTYYSPLNFTHEEKYDDKPRADIISLVPEDCRRILEIGCGTGATGSALKNRLPGLYYVGLEIDDRAVEIAQTRLDRVLKVDLGAINRLCLPLEPESFDLLIAADVLEHLYDPWQILYVLRGFLKAKGKALLSIPNTQNIYLIAQLVMGHWTYQKYGLLDATHIRFFTWKEIEKLLTGTGFRILLCKKQLQTDLADKEFPLDLSIANLVLRQVSREEAERLFTFQYLVLAAQTESEERSGP